VQALAVDGADRDLLPFNLARGGRPMTTVLS